MWPGGGGWWHWCVPYLTVPHTCRRTGMCVSCMMNDYCCMIHTGACVLHALQVHPEDRPAVVLKAAAGPAATALMDVSERHSLAVRAHVRMCACVCACTRVHAHACAALNARGQGGSWMRAH